jgi:hypothetical protein
VLHHLVVVAGRLAGDTAAAVSGKAPKEKAAPAAKKTITLPVGIKITIDGKRKRINQEMAAALRQAAEVLEGDGRSRKAG